MSDDELFDLYLTENETILTSLRKIYNKGKVDGRAEVIEECIETLKTSYPLVDDNDILYGFGCAIHRLEQLKENK